MTLKTIVLMTALVSPAVAVDWIPLWPGEAPGAPRPAAGSEHEREGARFSHTEVPSYALYRPETPNGTTVVVLPGGGYGFTSMANEGYPVGEWFARHGVTALVVKYRTSDKPEFGYHHPVQLIDARRAIRTARAKATEWGTDPAKVGVLGFSAGGHLASMCATFYDQEFEAETDDEIDGQNAKPAFAALIYPVIAMGESYHHEGSARSLLGPDATQEQRAALNTAKAVDAETPPCFLVHSADDGGVPIQNSLDFIAACAQHKVPVAAHFFSRGGHGYGWAGREDATDWPRLLQAWLENGGWMPK